MSEILGNNKELFCSHTKKSKEYNNNNIIYAYCEKCGNITIKNNNIFYYTIKPKHKQKRIEFNPILITKNMKRNQELSYHNLYNIYNLDITENISNIKENIKIYFKKRQLILLYLQNMTKKLYYCDFTFYHCLLLVDLYFTHNITEEMTNEELLHTVIGFFMISSKFKETDLFEPELSIFNNIDSNIIISKEKILLYETISLKLINYNFFIYSAYDWINIFIYNGYIFEGEIDNEEYINEIQIYTYRLLVIITPKNIFIKYSPFYIAISIIQITREDKIDENKVNVELFQKLLELYDIKFEDYENCYNEIKDVISQENNMNDNINKLDISNINTNRYQSPISKKLESSENIYRNSERINTFSNTEKIKKNNITNSQSKSNLKKKLKEVKLKMEYLNLPETGKAKKQFHSIIINNNINNKISNFNILKKKFQSEYINLNLPNSYNNRDKSNKPLKTEREVEGVAISSRKSIHGPIKNNVLNNMAYKNKIIKSKLGISINNKDLKFNIKKAKISPIKLKNLIKNGANERLEKINKDYLKFLSKNNTNIFHANKDNSLILNNNGDGDNLKYNNKKELNIVIKNYFIKNDNKISNNNIIISKNLSNIYKSNIKPLFRESTANNIKDNNNIINIKIENPLFLNKTKDNSENFKQKNKNKIKIQNFEKISSSNDKNKESRINNLTGRDPIQKSLLINLKFDKNSLGKDLYIKKSNYNYSKLPKLKLK